MKKNSVKVETEVELGGAKEPTETTAAAPTTTEDKTEGALGSSPDDKWQAGERILCFHGPLIYEAKIQQVC
jgi:hypothetical protein